MQRHNFKGQGASHGNHKKHRSPGSIGACATPARVFKGMKMAGQYGNEPHHHAEPRGGRGRRRARHPPHQGRGARSQRRPRVREERGQAPGRRGRRRGVQHEARREVGDRRADAGTVDVPDELFGIEPNTSVMHQVVTAQLAAARSGTHSTKTRAEVRGGGAKPWRQKGTGRARQGSIRAPHWRGGGVAHGPKPRDYRQRTPKKMIRLALRSALSDRAAEGKVLVLDEWGIDTPRTKAAIELLGAVGSPHRRRARRAGAARAASATRTRCGSRSATSASACRS